MPFGAAPDALSCGYSNVDDSWRLPCIRRLRLRRGRAMVIGLPMLYEEDRAFVQAAAFGVLAASAAPPIVERLRASRTQSTGPSTSVAVRRIRDDRDRAIRAAARGGARRRAGGDVPPSVGGRLCVLRRAKPSPRWENR